MNGRHSTPPAVVGLGVGTRLGPILDRLRAALRDRYETQQYSTPAEAEDGRRALVGRCVPVALVLGDLTEPGWEDAPGQFREAYPDGNQVLLTADGAGAGAAPPHVDYVAASTAPETVVRFAEAQLEMWAVRNPQGQPVQLIGPTQDPLGFKLRDHLARFDEKYEWLDPGLSSRGAKTLDWLARTRTLEPGLPVVVARGRGVLVRPEVKDLNRLLGLTEATATRTLPAELDDLIVIGAGPAGLAAAIHAGSRGWRTRLIARDFGGSAANAPEIRNYPGFPTGVSGTELLRLFLAQARALVGVVKLSVPREVTGLFLDGPLRGVRTVDDAKKETTHTGRAVLIAAGLVPNGIADTPGAPELLNKGVYYNTPPGELPLCRGMRVYMIGAGNAAGEGALMLVRSGAAEVTLLVRKGVLSMARYLEEDIKHYPAIRVWFHSELKRVTGTGTLEELVIEKNGAPVTVRSDRLFVCTGGTPNSAFARRVGRKPRGTEAFELAMEKNYLRTGPDLRPDELAPVLWAGSVPAPFETSIPGIFAAGDIRARSSKFVAPAVGEAFAAIDFVQRYVTPG